MLDLIRLRTLQRLAVEGTISATATSLGYSPSAVSQQLAALERDAGVALFDRRAHSITLTDGGQLLAEHATSLLGAAEEAEADLRAHAGRVGGRMTVSVIPNLATHVAVALADVQRDHADLEITMREAEADAGVDAVADHQSDLAVTDRWTRQRIPAVEGLMQRSLHADPIGLAAHPDSAPTGPSTPLTRAGLARAVTDLTWLCAPPGHVSRSFGDDLLDRAGVRPRRRWEFDGLITIAELVALDIGVALLPRQVVETQSPDRVRFLPLSPSRARNILATVRRSSVADPAIQVCLSAIEQRLQS